MFATLSKLSLLALASLALLSGTEATPNRFAHGHHLAARDLNTNAERLARGLNPLPPRSLFNPSKVLAARHGQPSGTPQKTYCIKVKKDNHEHVGYLSDNFDQSGKTYVVSGNKRDCLQVKLGGSGSGPFDITLVNFRGDFPERFLGLAAKTDEPSLKYALPVRSEQSSTPVKNKNSYDTVLPYSESQVWSTAGNVLSADWKAKNGVVKDIATYMVHDDDKLYFVTNYNSWKSDFARNYAVTLILEEA